MIVKNRWTGKVIGEFVVEPGANLLCVYLRDADLRDADLRDADLRDADLIGANLSGANLSGADLSGALLRLTNELIAFLKATK